MKKNILFVMNSLNCGGAEKSLISLLQVMDYSKYNVDLLLFKKEGIYLDRIPKEVNLLEEPYEYRYFDMSIKRALIECLKRGRLDIVLWRMFAGYIFQTEKDSVKCEQRVWKYISRSLRKKLYMYDIAIGYLEKNPIYFCIDKVKANKKIGFIHTDYEKLGMDSDIDMNYFKKLDNIVAVSDQSAETLKKIFPIYEEKVTVVYNTVLADEIRQLALKPICFDGNHIKIVSVGRLHQAKGFNLAIEACKLLINEGYNVKWYVIGEGPERVNLETLIHYNNLESNFILLGLKENPYPYIKQADLYVQTSLFEGRCLTITEAKILNKPIISTNFDVIYDQISSGHNGIIVQKKPDSIYEGIKKLIDNELLKSTIINNLSKEELGTEKEIDRLYKLLEN